jgi:DNA-binding NtrC family response regulator
MLEAVRRILTVQNEFEVFGYEHAADMLKEIQNNRPDVLILDVMVEDQMSGLLAYDEIRSLYPGLPIVMLTSLGDIIRPYFEDRGELPMILEKPITPDKLLTSLRLCMRPGARSEPGKP